MGSVYKIELPRRLADFIVHAMRKWEDLSKARYMLLPSDVRDAKAVLKLVEGADRDYTYRPRGSTKKPCPGCGKEGLRPTNGVCAECARLIKTGREAGKELAARDGGDPKHYRVPERGRSHDLPYILNDPDDPERRRTIQHAFLDLFFVVTEPSKTGVDGHDVARIIDIPRGARSDNYWSGELRLCRPDVRAALSALFAAVYAGMKHSYDEGLDDGRHLLKQLRDGEIAPQEFEDRTRKRS